MMGFVLSKMIIFSVEIYVIDGVMILLFLLMFSVINVMCILVVVELMVMVY